MKLFFWKACFCLLLCILVGTVPRVHAQEVPRSSVEQPAAEEVPVDVLEAVGEEPPGSEDGDPLGNLYNPSLMQERASDVLGAIRRASDARFMLPVESSPEMLEYAQAQGANGHRRYHQKADAMTPETQSLLLHGIYGVIEKSLHGLGVPISEAVFNQKSAKILRFFANNGIFPQALSVGYGARYQVGVGASRGTQFNFYFSEGKLKMSSYTVTAAHIGAAEMTRLELYVAFCFGSCVGGEPNGLYATADVFGGAGIGAGIFFEAGIDGAGLLDAATKKKLTFQDLLDSNTFFVGFDLDIGQGAGLSFTLQLYTQDFEKTLADPGKSLDPNLISSLKLH